MTLRELSLDELKTLHQTHLREAFPPEELKPYAAMEALCRRGAYHPQGAFLAGELVGYALLWESPGEGSYVLIDYLGVAAEKRGRGLGSQILACLKEEFLAWRGILVESEAPEGGETDALRRRRMDFYRRNGYTFLNYDCVLFGVHYAVCLCSPNGKGTEGEAMAAHQALYRSQFTPKAYETFIQIPRDPDHPLLPPESWADQATLPGLDGGDHERTDEP
jgi:GNAT superfamily N-acetyltransferase